jgi:NAD(P)-dependent dehydrogenase (short-subunit alcohol dehydrogenase family)
MSKLKEKIAIVTGGSGGIGSAAAALFVEQGARVLLVDLKPGPLEEVASRLGERARWIGALRRWRARFVSERAVCRTHDTRQPRASC